MQNNKIMGNPEEGMLLASPLPYDIFSNSILVNSYTVYMGESVKSPSQYSELIYTIENMEQHDTMRMVLNGPGGDAYTMIQLRNAMQKTQGHIVGVASGEVCSAHTMLFLSCHEFVAEDNLKLLAHNYSGIRGGKGYESHKSAEFDRKWSIQLMKDVYKDFLSPDELESLLKDEDFIFTAEEVNARCQDMISKQKKETLEEMSEEILELDEDIIVDREVYDMCIKHYLESLEGVNGEGEVPSEEMAGIPEYLEEQGSVGQEDILLSKNLGKGLTALLHYKGGISLVDSSGDTLITTVGKISNVWFESRDDLKDLATDLGVAYKKQWKSQKIVDAIGAFLVRTMDSEYEGS